MASNDENQPAGEENSTLAGTDFEPIDCIPKWTSEEWVSQNLPMVQLSAIMLSKSKTELTAAVQKILAEDGLLVETLDGLLAAQKRLQVCATIIDTAVMRHFTVLEELGYALDARHLVKDPPFA